MEPLINPEIALAAIVGHTAAGKTALAAALAYRLDGEIISADSRQVYRGMDLGTGKDYSDYMVGGIRIPCHLIDIRDPGEKYTLFDFQEDFRDAFDDIRQRGRFPLLCGGTGLYIESVLKGYELGRVPEDPQFRESCKNLTDEELAARLESFGPLHNTTDTVERSRLIRALEIATFSGREYPKDSKSRMMNFRVFAVFFEREERRERITSRLRERLENGMAGEVTNLLKTVPADALMYYGLEYRYLTLYCTGRMTYEEMFSRLNTAIHQFAKRQMTWFRGMEKRGIPITWIPGELSMDEKIAVILGGLGKRQKAESRRQK